ncbi:hypothetical protein CMI44_00750, partial [Candidatus Pacearchaeota archaeon]|nr:hypothetical protein [Candidatus Pacearchaeota archaeon]
MKIIKFPKHEHKGYKKDIKEGKLLWTSRIGKEFNKYKVGEIYMSEFEIPLKIIKVNREEFSSKHPNYRNLTSAQKKQLKKAVFYDHIQLKPLIKMKSIKIKEGWQCKVNIYRNFVIKEIKNRKDITKKIKKHLIKINKLDQLEKLTNNMIKDINNSTKILKNSKIPKELIAEAKFIDEKHVKQKRAKVVHEEIERLMGKAKIKQAKQTIDKSVNFFLTLWKYGVHDKSFKLTKNFGIINNKVALLDLFELTNEKSKVKKKLTKIDFNKKREIVEKVPKKLHKYFRKKVKETLT